MATVLANGSLSNPTSPANSWNTLAEANGCQITLWRRKAVPTRKLRRPISLLMSFVLIAGMRKFSAARPAG